MINHIAAEQIKRAADYIGLALCQHGCLVHRYDSKSTSSIYLKVDAGVACTVRLADHDGKDNLSYRFNYRAQVPGTGVECILGETDRYYYQAGAMEMMLADIIVLRDQRLLTYKDYQGNINDCIAAGKHRKGFWKNAYPITVVPKAA